MSTTTTPLTASALVQPARPPEAVALVLADDAPAGRLEAFNELTKPRITRLVTITAAVGFTLAAVGRQWDLPTLILASLGVLLGTALSSAGANALNQWMERSRDARMPRTRSRPIPAGRLSPAAAFMAGVLFSTAGVLALLFLAGPAPAAVSLATILVYVLIYTPLKPLTPLNTLVGAIPGALPPLIGWTAAADLASFPADFGFATLAQAGGWSLFLLMFVWQVPHSLALAWMYRDDYAAGGYRMLPVLDPAGKTTAAMILVWAIALLPATVAPAFLLNDRLSAVYAGVAAVTGLAFLAACVKLVRTHSRADAKAVFLASIAHLPLLLIVMVADTLACLIF